MQHLANVEQAPVDLDRNPAMRPVLRDPSRAPGYSEALGEVRAHRSRRTGVTGTVEHGHLAQNKIAAQIGQTSQALPVHPRRLRVVIVEDEVIVAMELEMLLEELNADVVGIATSAADACALVLEHQPDFVTMDINIKGDRDGVSAATDIFETSGIRSIFISSYSDLATQDRAAVCHAIAWIRKPIDTADLAEAVSRVNRRSD